MHAYFKANERVSVEPPVFKTDKNDFFEVLKIFHRGVMITIPDTLKSKFITADKFIIKLTYFYIRHFIFPINKATRMPERSCITL